MSEIEISTHPTTESTRLTSGDYTLAVSPPPIDQELWSPFDMLFESPYGPITHNSIREYLDVRSLIPRDWKRAYRQLQVFEIGPGLGEFTPALARISKHPPMACDPVDYDRLIYLLQQSKLQLNLNHHQRQLADELIRRAQVMLSPRVRLYNMTLDQFISTHPELQGCADEIVDLAGTSKYKDSFIKDARNWLKRK